MSYTQTSLRPYYNADTFNSPVKDHTGLVVHGTSTATSAAISEGLYGVASGGSSGHRSFDYLDMGELNGTADSANAIGLSVVRTYARVFVSQPFEVTRLLLQVGDFSATPASTRTPSPEVEEEDEEEEDDEEEDDEADDEISYFTAVTGDQSLQMHRRPKRTKQKKRRRQASATAASVGSGGAGPGQGFYPLTAPPVYVLELMGAVSERDGLKGLWRGLHTTFVLDALTATLEAWLSGFFAAVLDVPDPQFVEVLHSPAPLLALGSAVAARVATAVVLAPIDVIRTRLMGTTFATGPRSFRTSIAQLDSWIAPGLVVLPTILHTGLTSLVRLATPYVLYTRLGVDAFNQPVVNAFATLGSRLFELAIKLPLETMVRRAQLASQQLSDAAFVVAPKAYRGVGATLWDVLVGNDSLATLYRGWRIALAGTVGEWGVEASRVNDRPKERF